MPSSSNSRSWLHFPYTRDLSSPVNGKCSAVRECASFFPYMWRPMCTGASVRQLFLGVDQIFAFVLSHMTVSSLRSVKVLSRGWLYNKRFFDLDWRTICLGHRLSSCSVNFEGLEYSCSTFPTHTLSSPSSYARSDFAHT